ncbi:MAG: hypothetical protein H0X33_05110 [Taibaiella sp.]|nr:hypothetical protein [Taibaiella sp.]
MDTPHFDLVDITRAIQRRIRFVIIITVIAAILGAIAFGIRKKKYKAEGQFFVTNPIYGDRNNLFRSYETRFVDYFGGDDDLDKVTALAQSDTVMDRIIRNCQFQDVYHADINTPKGHAFLMGIFKKNFTIKRTEYKDMQVSYTAYDPQTSANVVNMSIKVLEQSYRDIYTNIKQGIYQSVKDKLKDIDSAVNALTDTLAGIRDQYKIYNIVNPSRPNAMSGEIKNSGSAGFGKAMEQVQNVEAVKDQMVSDRAHYISVLNEFSASSNDNMRYLKVITTAEAPVSPSGPGLLMTVIIAALLGLFFSVMYILLMAYYKMLNSVVR